MSHLYLTGDSTGMLWNLIVSKKVGGAWTVVSSTNNTISGHPYRNTPYIPIREIEDTGSGRYVTVQGSSEEGLMAQLNSFGRSTLGWINANKDDEFKIEFGLMFYIQTYGESSWAQVRIKDMFGEPGYGKFHPVTLYLQECVENP